MATSHGGRLTAREWDAILAAVGFTLAGDIAEAVGEELVGALVSAHDKLAERTERKRRT